MPKGQEKDSIKTSIVNSPDTQSDKRDVLNVFNILDTQQIKTAPFGANVSGESSYKRAERVSAALHLMTNHVPESEPLRTQTREKALALLSHILDLRSGLRSPSSEKGQVVLALIRELISLVRLLAIAGYISTQNSLAISEALDELGSLIVISQRSTLAEQFSISRQELTPPSTPNPPKPSVSFRTESKSTVKDNEKKISINPRAEKILDILKFGGEMSIKDITSNLPQYSEKMVQRELLSLVNLSRVYKIGEKRWSKYKIVQ